MPSDANQQVPTDPVAPWQKLTMRMSGDRCDVAYLTVPLSPRSYSSCGELADDSQRSVLNSTERNAWL